MTLLTWNRLQCHGFFNRLPWIKKSARHIKYKYSWDAYHQSLDSHSKSGTAGTNPKCPGVAQPELCPYQHQIGPRRSQHVQPATPKTMRTPAENEINHSRIE